MPLRSIRVDNLTVLDEIGAQISPSERLHNLVQVIAQAEVRKLAISLMFPLLEKFIMPIKLV
jgi:DNA replication protein DnaC